MDLATIMKRVGHDDAVTTMKIYTHITDKMKKDATVKVKIHFGNILDLEKLKVKVTSVLYFCDKQQKETPKALIYQYFRGIYYIMPPIPPISGIIGAPPFSGRSATTASVVKNSAATDAAF